MAVQLGSQQQCQRPMFTPLNLLIIVHWITTFPRVDHNVGFTCTYLPCQKRLLFSFMRDFLSPLCLQYDSSLAGAVLPALASTRSARWIKIPCFSTLSSGKARQALNCRSQRNRSSKTVWWCFHSESSFAANSTEPRQWLDAQVTEGMASHGGCRSRSSSAPGQHLVNTHMPLFLLAVQRASIQQHTSQSQPKQHVQGATDGCCSGHPTPAFTGSNKPAEVRRDFRL
jgi:hypothetical protein